MIGMIVTMSPVEVAALHKFSENAEENVVITVVDTDIGQALYVSTQKDFWLYTDQDISVDKFALDITEYASW